MEQPIVTEDGTPCKSVQEALLYKMDRTLAIGGLIIVALWLCWIRLPEGMQIVNTIVGGLIGYVGGRTGK
jgi:hypothetical protein